MFQRFSHLPWLRIILLTALTLRLTGAVLIQKEVAASGKRCLIAGDAEGYWMLARQIALGEDYAIYDPPRYVERMPGFPLFLASGMKLFGSNLLALRMLLALLGTAACFLVYLLGCEVAGRQAGLIACLLAALSPIFAVFSVMLLSETLFAGALLASLIALARLIRWEQHIERHAARRQAGDSSARMPLPHQTWMAAVAGVLCGVATLVRPTWLLVGPVFCLLLVISSRLSGRSLRQAGVLIVSLLLVLAPWGIRNYRVTGHFILTTLWDGPSLYDGLSPRATGDSNMDFVEKEGRYARYDIPDFEYQANEYYRRAALHFVQNHPRRAIALGFHKLGRYLNPFPNAEQFQQPAIWWSVGLFELPVLLLAAWGGWRLRSEWWSLWLTAGPVLYFALVHTVFVGSIRYRLPAEYPLLILSAVGIQALGAKWGRTSP